MLLVMSYIGFRLFTIVTSVMLQIQVKNHSTTPELGNFGDSLIP